MISYAFFQEMGELLKPCGNSSGLLLWSPGSTFRGAPSFAGVGRDRLRMSDALCCLSRASGLLMLAGGGEFCFQLIRIGWSVSLSYSSNSASPTLTEVMDVLQMAQQLGAEISHSASLESAKGGGCSRDPVCRSSTGHAFCAKQRAVTMCRIAGLCLR